MKKYVFSLLSTVSISSFALAIPAVDVVLGIGYNRLSPSGYMEYGNNTRADLEDDLNLGDSKKGYIYGIIDFPVLPAIKLEYMPFDYSGRGRVDAGFRFGDLVIPISSDVDSQLKFDQYDLSLYYSLPVPFIHPKLGLAVKYLDGFAQITDINTNDTERADITLPIPMVYIGADIRIPLIPKLSDINFDIEGKWIGYQGHSFTDIRAVGKIKLLKVPLVGSIFAGLGYKYQRIKIDNLEIDNKDFNSDIKFKGFLAEVGFEF